ncbi:hypothetical protein ABPG72_011857 [Tetrahymena utriculariae]
MNSQQTQEFEIYFNAQKKHYFLQKQLYFLKKQGYQSIIVLGKNNIGILLQAVSSDYGEVEINILDKELKYAKEIYNENVQIKGLVDYDNLIKIYEYLDCEELQAYFIIHEACDYNQFLLMKLKILNWQKKALLLMQLQTIGFKQVKSMLLQSSYFKAWFNCVIIMQFIVTSNLKTSFIL